MTQKLRDKDLPDGDEIFNKERVNHWEQFRIFI